MNGRLRALAAAAVFAGATAMPTAAWADDAGPTDYRSEIVSVTPAPGDAATFTVEGADAFLRARVEPGHDLVVFGYDGEEYIKIDGDGVVFENRASESFYYNRERYGGEVPDGVDSAAPPDWIKVDNDGEYAWHDHRAHWMSKTPLVGLRPGDALPPQVISVLVDEVPTEITVVTVLQRRASPVWGFVGLGLGSVVVAMMFVRRASLRAAALLATGAAVVVGVSQVLSVPASTGRPLVVWALPVVAVATVAVASRLGTDQRLSAAMYAAAAIELSVWDWPRLDGLFDAYRPSLLPLALERVLTVAIAVAAVGLFVAGTRPWWTMAFPARTVEPVDGASATDSNRS